MKKIATFWQATKIESKNLVKVFVPIFWKTALISIALFFIISVVFFLNQKIENSEIVITSLFIIIFSVCIGILVGIVISLLRVLWSISGYGALIILILVPLYSVIVFWLFDGMIEAQIKVLQGTLQGQGYAGAHGGGIIALIFLPFLLLDLLVSGFVWEFFKLLLVYSIMFLLAVIFPILTGIILFSYKFIKQIKSRSVLLQELAKEKSQLQ